MTIFAFSSDEAVLIILVQNCLSHGAVKPGNISDESLLKVAPDTIRDVQTWENGVYNCEV